MRLPLLGFLQLLPLNLLSLTSSDSVHALLRHKKTKLSLSLARREYDPELAMSDDEYCNTTTTGSIVSKKQTNSGNGGLIGSLVSRLGVHGILTIVNHMGLALLWPIVVIYYIDQIQKQVSDSTVNMVDKLGTIITYFGKIILNTGGIFLGHQLIDTILSFFKPAKRETKTVEVVHEVHHVHHYKKKGEVMEGSQPGTKKKKVVKRILKKKVNTKSKSE